MGVGEHPVVLAHNTDALLDKFNSGRKENMKSPRMNLPSIAAIF